MEHTVLKRLSEDLFIMIQSKISLKSKIKPGQISLNFTYIFLKF